MENEGEIKMQEKPEYLYHYTNLDTLALILKSRAIRFNSLKNMDDAEEVITQNSPYLGKYCFVSSWTDEEESIPIWNLYTRNMQGVRIKVKSYPFEKSKARLLWFDNGKEFETYYPKELIYHKNLRIYPTMPFLRQVEYSDNDADVFPEVISYFKRHSDGRADMVGNFNDINRYKRKKWDFLSEWRYGILLLPHDEYGRLKLDLTEGADDMPFWHYDIPMTQDAFETIEIMSGPKMGAGDKILLQCLVEKYCPMATVVESKLKIN